MSVLSFIRHAFSDAAGETHYTRQRDKRISPKRERKSCHNSCDRVELSDAARGYSRGPEPSRGTKRQTTIII